MTSNSSTQALSVLTAGLLLASSLVALPSFANGTSSRLRQGLPGRRISGGVRMDPPADSCFSNFEQSLVAITPRTNLSYTREAHPTFWFSMPETTDAKAVEFRLFNEADDMVYRTPIQSGSAFGITEFRLPETAIALNANENYKWVLTLACNNGSSAPILGLEGQIRRIEVSSEFTQQLASASPAERIQLYQGAGLWHEQVTELANLRRNHPDDSTFRLAWISLMDSTGLSEYLASNITQEMTVMTYSPETIGLSELTESEFTATGGAEL